MAEKFGKWLGGILGWGIAGPIGGLVGFSLGYLWDSATLPARYIDGEGQRRQHTRTHQGDFTVSLLVLSAAVMKADERVLKSELNYVKAFLRQQFGEEKSLELLRVLRDLLERDIPLAPVCRQIRTHMSHPQRLQLMHFLLGIANSDGELHAREWEMIRLIAGYLYINPKDLESIGAMYQVDKDRYYRILEIESEASEEEIKTAYRKMAKKYHPDRLGEVGDDVRKAAEEKFHQVQEAYEQLTKK